MSSSRAKWLNNLAPAGRIFMKFKWIFFENLSIKLHFHETLTTITALYMQTDIHFWSYLAHFFWEWEMLQTNVVQKINTHFLFSMTVFRKSYRLWDNVENTGEPDRPAMTKWRVHISQLVTKATNTHSEYVIRIAFPLQQWLHERACKLRYTYCTVAVLCNCEGVCSLRGANWIFVYNWDQLIIAFKGSAIAQAVSCFPFTAEVLVRSQASPRDICGGQSGTVTGFSLSTSVSPVTIIPPFFHTHLHLHFDLTRRTNALSLGPSKTYALPDIGEDWVENYFQFWIFKWSIWIQLTVYTDCGRRSLIKSVRYMEPP